MENQKSPNKDNNRMDALRSGTGFMQSLTESLRRYEDQGYTENFTLRFDHLECQDGRLKIYPPDFILDEIERFENTSDPDDQTILYVISIPKHGLKGLSMESYGSYHEDMSDAMLEHIKKQRLLHNHSS